MVFLFYSILFADRYTFDKFVIRQRQLVTQINVTKARSATRYNSPWKIVKVESKWVYALNYSNRWKWPGNRIDPVTFEEERSASDILSPPIEEGRARLCSPCTRFSCKYFPINRPAAKANAIHLFPSRHHSTLDTFLLEYCLWSYPSLPVFSLTPQEGSREGGKTGGTARAW